MLCPYCGNKELMVNGMEPETGQISYVCWNPKCEKYKVAFYATGRATDTLIQENKEVTE